MTTILEDLVKRISNIENTLENTATADTFIRLERSTANVTDPPTDAELNAEFGTPVTAEDGFFAVSDDNDSDTNIRVIYTNGTSWWYSAKLTKAV